MNHYSRKRNMCMSCVVEPALARFWSEKSRGFEVKSRGIRQPTIYTEGHCLLIAFLSERGFRFFCITLFGKAKQRITDRGINYAAAPISSRSAVYFWGSLAQSQRPQGQDDTACLTTAEALQILMFMWGLLPLVIVIHFFLRGLRFTFMDSIQWWRDNWWLRSRPHFHA